MINKTNISAGTIHSSVEFKQPLFIYPKGKWPQFLHGEIVDLDDPRDFKIIEIPYYLDHRSSLDYINGV
jgi:hypothetical protein